MSDTLTTVSGVDRRDTVGSSTKKDTEGVRTSAWESPPGTSTRGEGWGSGRRIPSSGPHVHRLWGYGWDVYVEGVGSKGPNGTCPGKGRSGCAHECSSETPEGFEVCRGRGGTNDEGRAVTIPDRDERVQVIDNRPRVGPHVLSLEKS